MKEPRIARIQRTSLKDLKNTLDIQQSQINDAYKNGWNAARTMMLTAIRTEYKSNGMEEIIATLLENSVKKL